MALSKVIFAKIKVSTNDFAKIHLLTSKTVCVLQTEGNVSPRVADASSGGDQAALQTKLKSLSCEPSAVSPSGGPPAQDSPGSGGTMVVRPSPPSRYQHTPSAPFTGETLLQPLLS